jgi:hypothetical protein
MCSSAGDTATNQGRNNMNMNELKVYRQIDTLEEIIATFRMFDREKLLDIVQGSAIWVDQNISIIDDETLAKFDRLQTRIEELAA